MVVISVVGFSEVEPRLVIDVTSCFKDTSIVVVGIIELLEVEVRVKVEFGVSVESTDDI